MQIRKNKLIIISAGEQVISGRRETYAPDVSGVRFEALHGSAAPDVEENAATVLVTGNQKTSGWIDAERRDRAANLQRDQMLIRHKVPALFDIDTVTRPIKVRS